MPAPLIRTGETYDQVTEQEFLCRRKPSRTAASCSTGPFRTSENELAAAPLRDRHLGDPPRGEMMSWAKLPACPSRSRKRCFGQVAAYSTRTRQPGMAARPTSSAGFAAGVVTAAVAVGLDLHPVQPLFAQGGSGLRGGRSRDGEIGRTASATRWHRPRGPRFCPFRRGRPQGLRDAANDREGFLQEGVPPIGVPYAVIRADLAAAVRQRAGEKARSRLSVP